ncbi:ubiquitin metalloprotease fusion [Pyrenophora seminiperda CCB06]|uniref:Ubiquitin metalloprotease fusion n=1 Tax=Pyrenophora seminiperda CCB06 TaxID=1302712 RepID=A0A3M7LY35_9PLEO|nr:ubiquitin metalloprotease fusion [Pyrenophora seminiperda CCB06]
MSMPVFFVPLLILIASAWCVVGILLAKWLKQAGHARPFSGRRLSAREVYGGGGGVGRVDRGVGRELYCIFAHTALVAHTALIAHITTLLSIIAHITTLLSTIAHITILLILISMPTTLKYTDIIDAKMAYNMYTDITAKTAHPITITSTIKAASSSMRAATALKSATTYITPPPSYHSHFPVSMPRSTIAKTLTQYLFSSTPLPPSLEHYGPLLLAFTTGAALATGLYAFFQRHKSNRAKIQMAIFHLCHIVDTLPDLKERLRNNSHEVIALVSDQVEKMVNEHCKLTAAEGRETLTIVRKRIWAYRDERVYIEAAQERARNKRQKIEEEVQRMKREKRRVEFATPVHQVIEPSEDGSEELMEVEGGEDWHCSVADRNEDEEEETEDVDMMDDDAPTTTPTPVSIACLGLLRSPMFPPTQNQSGYMQPDSSPESVEADNFDEEVTTPLPADVTSLPEVDTPLPEATVIEEATTPLPAVDTSISVVDTPLPAATVVDVATTPLPLLDYAFALMESPAVDTLLPSIDAPLPLSDYVFTLMQPPAVDTPLPAVDTPLPAVDTPVLAAATPLPTSDGNWSTYKCPSSSTPGGNELHSSSPPIRPCAPTPSRGQASSSRGVHNRPKEETFTALNASPAPQTQVRTKKAVRPTTSIPVPQIGTSLFPLREGLSPQESPLEGTTEYRAAGTRKFYHEIQSPDMRTRQVDIGTPTPAEAPARPAARPRRAPRTPAPRRRNVGESPVGVRKSARIASRSRGGSTDR